MSHPAAEPDIIPGSPLTVFTEEEELFRQTVASFANEQVRPLVAEMDRDQKINPGIIKQCFEMGLMGIEIPEAYGGSGGSFFMACLAVEELSRVDPSVGVIVDVQNTLVANAFLNFASEEQKKTYLPRLASEWVGAYALSEASSGSDAFALTTKAEDKGDHWLLNGRKLWITNALEAGVFIVFATVDPSAGYKGITAFIVERGFPGFSVGKKEHKLGIRASSTCELLFDNCEVPKANVLGDIGKGYKIAIMTLNEGRIGIGAQMVGLSRGSLECGIAYAKERVQFGKPIASFQGLQFQIARCAADVESARLLVYNAARLRDAGKPFLTEAAIAKLLSSEVAERVSSQVVEFYGGYGYTSDYPAEKYFRDSKIGKIYEGTSNMQLGTIAKQVIGDL
ncbi:MAG: acyl-CoA dehydrogenase [Blastocatellia bacterium]|jgi:butyryl-CoA dehydrogenase/short/branched chain acyl-CoA dehydrogenase|nr:acyl-CoA dehydrogenase [Blastocatellia bacterium]MBK6428016.1 acyl-CoA dehydrogenase [Blastocatellia bacterium]